MYDAVEDPYCYPGTTVLKNKLKLKTQSELNSFEAEITSQRAEEPLPAGKLTYPHYRAIHKHLFQDVYDWARKVRTVRISKGGSMFCYPESIDREMSKLFGTLAGQKHFKGTTPSRTRPHISSLTSMRYTRSVRAMVAPSSPSSRFLPRMLATR
jgi:cell filamentation protein